MPEVLRVLTPEEVPGIMPARELLEPEASQVTLATAMAISDMISAGVKRSAGHLLVRLENGTEVSARYGIYIK